MHHWPQCRFTGIASAIFATVVVLLCSSIQIFSAAAQEKGPEQQATVALTPDELEWINQHPVIRVGVGRAFPPFQYLDEAETFQGMASDYLLILRERLGLNLEVQRNLTWAEVMEKSRKREVDMWVCASETPDRKEFMLFTKPYLSFPLVIITRKDSPVISGVQDLENKKVAITKGLASHAVLSQNPSQQFVFVAQTLDELLAVATGKADASVCNLAVASYLIEKHNLTNLKVAAPANLNIDDLRMAVRSDWPELVGILQKGLDSISFEEHEATRRKWIPIHLIFGLPPGEVYRYAAIIGAGILVFLVMFFVWNRRLAKEVSVRRRAEEELRERQAELQSILRAAPVGIGMVIDRVILEANDTLCRMTGYNREELLGQGARMLYPTQEDFTHVGQEKYRDIAKSGIGTVETRWQRKDGSIIHILLSSAALDAADLSRGVTFMALDITEAKRAEQEKLKADAHLRHVQKMEALGTLAGGVAHDFNNILGIIIGYAEIASWRSEAQEGIKKNLEQVLKAAHRAKDLVRQILAFSRASEQEKKPVQISIIVKEALKMLRASLPATIEIRSRFADGSVIMGSPTEIHQVLMNLCTNSAHAMREHGGVLEVTVAGVRLETEADAAPWGLRPGPYVELAVKDTGSGMDQATIERIFDPFFTTKGPGEGTGLGLAVVHGIVERHSGAVQVESEPGKGSCFRVLFPVIEERQPATDAPPTAALPRGRERILVVDDEPLLAEVTQEILTGLGYRVDVETSPVEALKTLQSRGPEAAFDLLITDMTMPHWTGADLVRELRSRQMDLPVILCTGFSDRVDAQRAVELGMQGFLMKPVVAKNLAELVRQVLDEGHPKNP